MSPVRPINSEPITFFVQCPIWFWNIDFYSWSVKREKGKYKNRREINLEWEGNGIAIEIKMGKNVQKWLVFKRIMKGGHFSNFKCI